MHNSEATGMVALKFWYLQYKDRANSNLCHCGHRLSHAMRCAMIDVECGMTASVLSHLALLSYFSYNGCEIILSCSVELVPYSSM